MSVAAYRRTISDTESPRQIERRVLVAATSRLEEYRRNYDVAEHRIEKLNILAKGLSQALWRNEEIWMALKADLMADRNCLDNELRASLISLAIWVERHTASVLSGAKKVAPLIEINRSIIDGLAGQDITSLE